MIKKVIARITARNVEELSRIAEEDGITQGDEIDYGTYYANSHDIKHYLVYWKTKEVEKEERIRISNNQVFIDDIKIPAEVFNDHFKELEVVNVSEEISYYSLTKENTAFEGTIVSCNSIIAVLKSLKDEFVMKFDGVYIGKNQHKYNEICDALLEFEKKINKRV